MSAFVTAGGGFLLAVLWFDLMFDVQVVSHRGRELPEEVLASIAGYYRRVTTAARPMNSVVAAVMLATLAAVIAEIAKDEHPRWATWASLAAALPPMLLAGGRTVPNAVRLGARKDSAQGQSALAVAVWRDHVFCAVAIAVLLVLQLACK